MPLKTSELTFSRQMPLPPAKMWPVLISPEMRAKWGAPSKDSVLINETTDTRVGGLERALCGPKDNPEFIIDTRWYRLDAPALAVFTETLIIGGDALCVGLVTYGLTESGSGTALDVSVALSSFVEEDLSEDVQQGWEGGLSNLESLVASLVDA